MDTRLKTRKWDLVCEACGTGFYRCPSSTNKKKGHAVRFCSMECRSARADSIERMRKALAEQKDQLRLVLRIHRQMLKLLPRVVSCRHCGADVLSKKTAGRRKDVCDACKRNMVKTLQATRKRLRKAVRKRVDAESVNRLAVFERDAWTCRVCVASLRVEKTLVH